MNLLGEVLPFRGLPVAVGQLVTLSLIFFGVNKFLMYQVSGSWSLWYVSTIALGLINRYI